MNIPTTFDATAPMDAGAPFAALGVTSDASGLGDDAFTIDGTTFDPGADGFTLSGSGINLALTDPNTIADSLDSALADYTPSADLPELGTVYGVTDFGGGFEKVYEAVPNADGTAAGSITDYLVTPFGNVDPSSLFGTFNAVNPLDPGDAVARLDFGSAADADTLSFLGL